MGWEGTLPQTGDRVDITLLWTRAVNFISFPFNLKEKRRKTKENWKRKKTEKCGSKEKYTKKFKEVVWRYVDVGV